MNCNELEYLRGDSDVDWRADKDFMVQVIQNTDEVFNFGGEYGVDFSGKNCMRDQKRDTDMLHERDIWLALIKKDGRYLGALAQELGKKFPPPVPIGQYMCIDFLQGFDFLPGFSKDIV